MRGPGGERAGRVLSACRTNRRQHGRSMSDSLKAEAGAAALEYVSDGMRLGIGTGSTAEAFVRALASRVADGLNIIEAAFDKISLASSIIVLFTFDFVEFGSVLAGDTVFILIIP